MEEVRRMAVLFDLADDYVSSVLDVAKVHGEISLADLEAICEAGIEVRHSVSTQDIGDTIDALANMGIEVDNSLPEAEEARRDAAFLQSMRERAREGATSQLTGAGWLSLLRAIEREKAAQNATVDHPKPSADDEVPVKRTFFQEMVAGIGPRVRRTRPK
jgi:hypothetical protein